jgi:hypothetical protein
VRHIELFWPIPVGKNLFMAKGSSNTCHNLVTVGIGGYRLGLAYATIR